MAIPIRVGQIGQSKTFPKANRKTQDPRLWLGIAFVFAAMIIGQLVISKASARVSALALNANISQGAIIRASDVSSVQVAIPNPENLISVPSDAIGKVAATDLFFGDLISTHSISTPSLDGVALPGPATLIIPSAVIASAPEVVDSGMDTSVTVQVSQDQVQVLVQAMRDGVIDLVAIPISGNES
jgi:hypothetical protein